MILRGFIIISTIAISYVKASCEVVEWSGGHFEFPTPETKCIYQSNGRYVPKNMIATRAQIFRDDIFVALPRYKPGVPVTLARVYKKHRGCEAILMPYPCWASQEEGDCNALQSVVDIFIDLNNILWALDVGVTNTLENPVRRCPPKVVAYNIATGKKVKTLDLCGLVAQASRLQYIVVEYTPDGRPFVYISDAATRSILVFDVAGNKGFRVVLPKAAANSRRDVLYIALILQPTGNTLVITYLSGTRVFAIPTEFLRGGCAEGRVQDLGKKEGKVILLGTDGGSALFFRFEGNQDVYRWNYGPLFTGYEAVYKSPECYLATEVMPDTRRQRMRVLESNFPDFIQGTVGCGTSQRVALMISEVPKKLY